jgi:hypothetical protein
MKQIVAISINNADTTAASTALITVSNVGYSVDKDAKNMSWQR